MNSLFPLEPALPQGFSYHEDFISKDEEANLLKTISTINLNRLVFHGYEAKRKVASYGYDWSFEKRTLTRGKDIPDEFVFLIEKFRDYRSLPGNSIAELLVTEYPIGAVINWHRDAPPFDMIAGISLASACTFQLRPYEKAKQNRKALISFEVKQRSLYIMQGPSRSEWEHRIAPVKQPRYSITLRTLRT